MNINRKFIIILGVSTLLIITIFGLKAYYQERISQIIPISDEDISFEKTFDKNYPTSLEETIFFRRICANALISGSKQNHEAILCVLKEDKSHNINDQYTTLPILLKIIPNLPIKQYIAIAVSYNDILQKNKSRIPSEESTFNLCTITKPVLLEPFREELLLKDQINLNRNIVFSEGEVFCSKFFGLPNEGLPDEGINLLISGFVSQADLFEVKIYLILEDIAVNELLSQESFSNIEEILQSYPLLWNVEKPNNINQY